MTERDRDELTPDEEAELDAAIERLVAQIECATRDLAVRVSELRAENEVRELERMWRLQ